MIANVIGDIQPLPTLHERAAQQHILRTAEQSANVRAAHHAIFHSVAGPAKRNAMPGVAHLEAFTGNSWRCCTYLDATKFGWP